MAQVYVKPGNTVEHDGVAYGENEKAGPRITLSDEQATALLKVGVVQTVDPVDGVVDNLLPTDEEINEQVQANPNPTPEEVAKTAEQAGKKGLFGRIG